MSAAREARARELLAALDSARLVPLYSGGDPAFDLKEAWATADALRRLRIARGERPVGYKIGFTNRGIWDRYGVHEPIWGPVWDTTLEQVEGGEARVSLARFSQPRLEPEVMFGLVRAPRAGMTEAELAGCIAWVAHGFEIVHTRFVGWRFAGADTVADFALHGRLFVGPRVSVDRFVGKGSGDLAMQLSSLRLTLSCDGRDVEEGSAEIVLDGPLHALRLWVDAMADRPERWPIVAGDIVTTGTITDAAPLAPGQRWQTRLSDPRFVGMTLNTTA